MKPGTRRREYKRNRLEAGSLKGSYGFPGDDVIVPGIEPYRITLRDVLLRARARKLLQGSLSKCLNCDYRNKSFFLPRPENIDRWCLIAMVKKGQTFRCPEGREYGKVIAVTPQKEALPSGGIKGDLMDIQRQFVPKRELRAIYLQGK